MPAAVRTRLPALIAAALALEFWAELALLVPGRHAVSRARGAAAGRDGDRAGVTGGALRWRASSSSFGVVALLPALTRVYYDELLLPFATPFVAAFWLGALRGHARAARRARCSALPLGLAATRALRRRAASTSGLFTLAVSLGAPVLVGRLLRSRAALHRALREKAALLERRREDAAGRAVVDERTRIAGELHDVVAHALSAMTVQATGARRLTLTRPELARAAFEAIETRRAARRWTSCAGCSGVLRREDAELTLAPQPSLRHVESLVRRTTAAGLPVTAARRGRGARARRRPRRHRLPRRPGRAGGRARRRRRRAAPRCACASAPTRSRSRSATTAPLLDAPGR